MQDSNEPDQMLCPVGMMIWIQKNVVVFRSNNSLFFNLFIAQFQQQSWLVAH